LQLNLLRYRCLGCVFVDPIRPDPAKDLLFGKVGVRREIAFRRGDGTGGVDRGRVAVLLAIAAPVYGDHNVRQIAFLYLALHCINLPSDHDGSFYSVNS
jgi:hypothetical protein